GIATLAVGGYPVEPSADDDLALVGLAEIGAGSEIEQHRVETWFYGLRHHGLQCERAHRQGEAGLCGKHAGMARDRHADDAGAYLSPRCLHAHAASVLDEEVFHLA